VSEQEAKHDAPSGQAPATVVVRAENQSVRGAVNAVAAPRSGSSVVAWLALLLVVVLACVLAWMLREAQGRETALAERIADVEMRAAQKQAEFDERSDRLQKEQRIGLDKLDAATSKKAADLSAALQSVEEQLAAQKKELARFSATDRDGWLLAEAGHLLRLANQRLVMAGDPVAAQALLNSADTVLRELDDPALHEVRAAVAADVAALRAVDKVDVEGIYLRLAALIEQAEKLVIFQLPEITPSTAPEAANDWQGRLRQGYAAALSKLADYIIIRRRDVPMQALMDPQWEGLVRLNLRMLLEQAQVALLSANQTLYDASLEDAQQWVAQFQDSDAAAASAITAEITQLAALTIEIPQPDISRSQRALDDAIEQRLQAARGVE
jgi:uroporphyrin-3 C-methyltransferase